MEVALLYKDNLNAGYGSQSRSLIQDMVDKCRMFDGEFTLLWHNSSFTTSQERDLFEFALDA